MEDYAKYIIKLAEDLGGKLEKVERTSIESIQGANFFDQIRNSLILPTEDDWDTSVILVTIYDPDVSLSAIILVVFSFHRDCDSSKLRDAVVLSWSATENRSPRIGDWISARGKALPKSQSGSGSPSNLAAILSGKV